MKIIILAALIGAAFLMGCTQDVKKNGNDSFADEVRLPMTPVKNQGRSNLCWAYAMLATIETEHITRGDSVNLSAAYVGRMALSEQVDGCFLNRGKKVPSTRGVMPDLIRIIQTYGLMPYDSYRSAANFNTTARKLQTFVRHAAMTGRGIDKARNEAKMVLDASVNPLPYHVYMYGMEYTPIEFAHSVCMPDEYQAFTSFTHMPMNKRAVLAVPDNRHGERFTNVGIDQLMALMETSLRKGHPVCWEGDVSEEGFSFKNGVADVAEADRKASQEKRQREFETFRTTDDHCMAIIGIAHDKQGKKFFICKNSWGEGNRYGGLMYMSFDYARLKTVGIMVNNIIFS